MLLGLKEIEKIENYLDKQVTDDKIYKYRIYLNLDTTISIDIVSDSLQDNIQNEIIELTSITVTIDEWISKDEYYNDNYYKKLFEIKIDKHHRRRLNSLLNHNVKESQKTSLPIVTFYSYKGGVGRTTSLITFANYYAYHYAKKIVILDFDFEAPGFINYFDFSMDALENKNGIVEYILDKQASKEKLNLIQDYTIEVSKEYTNNGSIYVMPSGNLFGKENLESYMEALARIDINSTDQIVEQILKLIEDIKSEINPDMILIDSRTGFNDIFGFLINKISDTIVGLFEGNIQTDPGLKIFLNEIYNIQQEINPIIVNSLVHKSSSYSKRLKEFTVNVNNCIVELTDENFAPEILDIRPHSILENLGTIENDRDDYFDFIKENTPNDYKKLFNKIIEHVQCNKKDYNRIKIVSKVNKKIISQESDKDIFNLRKSLLNKIYKNYPKNYAEDIEYDENFLNKQFYFRKCMEDIFNFDKFLLIGTKGTGKTAFYTALKHNNFLENLKKKANKKQLNFQAIDIISHREDKNKDRYFEVNKHFTENDIKDKELFFTRFWMIYILNSILLKKDIINYNTKTNLNDILPIKLNNTIKNKIFLNDLIFNDKKILLIEDELNEIDLFLKKKDLNLMITFDQLDHIIKPKYWSYGVAPLIDYCQTMPYLKIQPKIFIRRDLFDKLTNLTNKKSLDTKSINLEWSKDEVFAFFFKVIFAYTKEDFFKILKLYDIQESIIKIINKKIEKTNNYNQIDLDIYYLEILVEVFFGKYPNPNNNKTIKYSKTYDWFYESLADANNTISLRPFLDLIKFAIEKYLKEDTSLQKPILHPYFYNHKEIRKECVKNYFDDLANEEGNEDFKKIIEFIKNSSKFPVKFKQRRLKGKTYDEFLKYFLDNLELEATTKEEIEELLKLNGAISIHYYNQTTKVCAFAFLYKYYLNLKG